MQPINQEFIDAVIKELNELEPGYYLTREQICAKIGVLKEYSELISVLHKVGKLPGFKMVKSRGITPIRKD